MALLASAAANAQLPANSIGQDFTVTAYQPWLSAAGMNSNGTYNLYDYLDQGYTVFLDVSATWCGPCWNYHLGGALEELYANHGPAGAPGVSPTTTDDVMVIWIEGDGTTADPTMLDGSGAIGNWIEPSAGTQIQFPMANPASTAANAINTDYAIGYFPTIYKICPNRIVNEIGQETAANLYASVGTCPPAASQPADVAAINYEGITSLCAGSSITLTPAVQIQNNGTNALTSATITITQGGTTVSTGTFSGNLSTYDFSTVTCTPISGFTGGTLNITVTTSGDALATNGTLTQSVTAVAASNMITGAASVEIATDRYGSETTWQLRDGSGSIVLQGGPYTNAAANGVYPQTTQNFTINSNECYSLEIQDGYGDGFTGSYGNGYLRIVAGGSNQLVIDNFTTTEQIKKGKSGTASINDASELISMSVFPNPASTNVTVSFEGKSTSRTPMPTPRWWGDGRWGGPGGTTGRR